MQRRGKRFSNLLGKKRRAGFAEGIREARRKDRLREWGLDAGLDYYSSLLRADLGKAVERIIKERGGCRVLDVGCGGGNFLAELKARFGGAVETHGLSLTRARNPAIDHRHSGTIENYLFAQKFDLIASSGGVWHSVNKSAALENICNSLETGGVAFIEIGPYTLSEKIRPVRAELQKNGFAIEEVKTSQRVGIAWHIKNIAGKRANLYRLIRKELKETRGP